MLAMACLCASSFAQDRTMSLKEASYRAGKTRISARYQEELATCKGLGNAQARSACAAAAAINRDAMRRALKSDMGPTGLSLYLAQAANQQHEATPTTATAPRLAPQRTTTAAAAATVQIAGAQQPRAPKPVLTATMSPLPVAAGVPVAALQSSPASDDAHLVTSYAVAFKASYGGN